MLNKNAFKEQMQRLSYVYPTWKIDLENSKAIQAWYNEFRNCDESRFIAGIGYYIRKNEYQPTIAGLINAINKRTDTKGNILNDEGMPVGKL